MTQTRLKIDSFVFEGLYIKALAIPENENTLSTDFKSVDVHTLACWLPRYSHYEGSDYGFFLERTEKDIRDLLQQMINEYQVKYPMSFNTLCEHGKIQL